MKLLMGFFILLFSNLCSAQVQVFNLGLSSKYQTIEQVFGHQVYNGSGVEQEIYYLVSLNDRYGNTLFKAETKKLILKIGSNSITMNSLLTNAEFLSKDFESKYRTKGYIPDGVFNICLNIISVRTSEKLKDYCQELVVESRLFLNLTYPLNMSIVEVVQSLTWQPIQINGNVVKYHLKLTEIRNNQSVEEALSNNPSMIEVNGLINCFYPISTLNKSFENGKSYAWQVLALSENRNPIISEIWKFTLKSDEVNGLVAQILPVAKSTEMGNLLQVPNILQFKIEGHQFNMKPDMKIEILDIEKNKVIIIDDFEYSTNDYVTKINLLEFLPSRKNKVYLLSAKEFSSGKTYFIKFEY